MKFVKEIILKNKSIQDEYIISVYDDQFHVYNKETSLTFGFETLEKLAEVTKELKKCGYAEIREEKTLC